MKSFFSSDTYPCELCGRECIGASAMAAVCDECTGIAPAETRVRSRESRLSAMPRLVNALLARLGRARPSLPTAVRALAIPVDALVTSVPLVTLVPLAVVDEPLLFPET